MRKIIRPSLSGVQWGLLSLAFVAVIAGIVARMNALSAAPLATDEFLLYRSAQKLLLTGIPGWDCGGIYIRALLNQYALAGLLGLGISPELATRSFTVVFSLAALPAAYLLGARLGGAAAGLISLVIAAVSVWDVEMARFGRMYAPMQAITLWYLYFFVAATLDGNARSRKLLFILALLATLIWEGGALLFPIALLSYVWNRPEAVSRPAFLMKAVAVLVVFALLIYVLTVLDTRSLLNDAPIYAQGAVQTDEVISLVAPPWKTVVEQAKLAVPFALLLLGSVGLAIYRMRQRPLLATGFIALAMFAVAFHQFFLAGLLILLALLAGWMTPAELRPGRNPWIWMVTGFWLAAWLAWCLLADDWIGYQDMGISGRLRLAGAAFLKYPHVVDSVVRPWASAVPRLSLWASVLLAVSVVVGLRLRTDQARKIRLILFVVILMVMAVGFADPFYHETRYSFFLYLPAVITGVAAITVFAGSIFPAAVAAVVSAAAVLGTYVLTEDLDVRHLARVASPEYLFRVGMGDTLGAHYYMRHDLSGAAQWLYRNAQDGDLVFNSVIGFTHYYKKVDVMFFYPSHPAFAENSCQRSTVDRWSNLPLVYRADQIDALVSRARGAVWVVTSDQTRWRGSPFERYGLREVWRAAGDRLEISKLERNSL